MLKIIATLNNPLKYAKMSILKKIEVVDVIAIICVIFGFLLMAFHIDTVVGGVVTLIVGYYFGHKRSQENHHKENV